MSKLTLYASELEPFPSVISCFDGTSRFVIETPYFKLAGARPCDPKSFMASIGDSKGGLFLNAPKILVKNTQGVFTPFFVIGWTSVVQGQKLKKEYRIHAPYGGQPLKRKQKLMVSPGSKDLADDDNKLLLFSWQLNLAQDVLLIAHVLQLNLAKYQGMDNAKFYPAFIKDANDKLKAKKAQTLMEVDTELVNSWTSVPVASKSKRKEDIFIFDTNSPQDEAFEPLMRGFYESVTSIKGKADFGIKFIERVWDRPNCFSIPSFRLRTFVKKDDPEGNTLLGLDCRLLIVSKIEDPKDKEYNAKIPDTFCTARQVSKTRKVRITKNTLPELWGQTEYHENPEKHESAKFAGCIFVQPQLSFSFHEKGSPTIDWRADTLALNRVVRQENDDLEDACDFMEEGEFGGSGDGEKPSTPPGEDDAGDFVGNEKDVDPDAWK